MRNSLSIVLSGEAGQGLQTTEELLVAAASMSYHVFSVKDVMSRVRGGNNTVEIRISDEPIHAFQNNIDLLFLLNDNSLYRLTDRVHDQTVIWGEKELGLQEIAKESGGAMFLSVVLFGFIARLLNLDQKSCNSLIQNRFASKSDKIITDNLNAFDAGYRKGASFSVPKQLKTASLSKKYKTIDGNIAVGIGALAGGCNYISSYPMSPSTGVLIYLVNQSKDFDILTEQAEDEIAAANMAIGAWYAGARGLVTTSGGGFDLMQEAISLSGITETPCVIHLAQRPGPGTGLPTRTEQADLNLAVYSGHGEFPRIVLAPGNLEDAVRLTQKSFYLADKYQVPVFILTDQFLLDSNAQMEHLILDDTYLQSFIVETNPDYKRYALNESGISQRGIPGFGTGFVKVDSDEHDESGMITEDYKMRNDMNEKRLKKRQLLLSEYEAAELIGPEKFTHLVVGWGSTYGVLKEFIETNGRDDTSFLNIKQVFPLHENLIPYFKQAKSVTVVENNATGQLARLLKTELDIHVDHSILKYSGEPFSIEEIEKKLKEVLEA